MKKQLLSCCLAALGLTAIQAQSFNEWKDPEVNSVNRSAMHTNYFAYASADEAKAGIKENSTNFMTLNGPWKFNWVRHADARPTDFYQTNFNDKGWDDLQVVADGDNVLQILALGAKKGDTLRLDIDGDDEEVAAKAIEELLHGAFVEKKPVDVLKIAFFGTKDYDRTFFSELVKDKGQIGRAHV